MKPGPFVRAANSRDLVGPGPFAVSASGVDVALVRTGAGWRAFQGRCPHQGALLGEGEINGDRLVCRNHRWRFSLDSGRRDGGPECLASCPAAERDGAIFIDVSGLEPGPLRSRSANDPWTNSRAPSPGRFSAMPIRSICRRPISFSRAGPGNMGRRTDSWRGLTPIVVTSDGGMINEFYGPGRRRSGGALEQTRPCRKRASRVSLTPRAGLGARSATSPWPRLRSATLGSSIPISKPSPIG